MLDKFLLIRPAQFTCLVSISKRFVRAAPPPANSTESSTTAGTKEEKTAIDSTGKVFTFKHG